MNRRTWIHPSILGDPNLMAAGARGMRGLLWTPWIVLFAAKHGRQGVLLVGRESADPEDIAASCPGATPTAIAECLDSLEAIGYVRRTTNGARRLSGRLWNRPTISPRQRHAVLSRDGHRCSGCSATSDLQVDHIRPWSRGGLTVLNNLRTLCGTCNRRKSDRMPAGELG